MLADIASATGAMKVKLPKKKGKWESEELLLEGRNVLCDYTQKCQDLLDDAEVHEAVILTFQNEITQVIDKMKPMVMEDEVVHNEFQGALTLLRSEQREVGNIAHFVSQLVQKIREQNALAVANMKTFLAHWPNITKTVNQTAKMVDILLEPLIFTCHSSYLTLV